MSDISPNLPSSPIRFAWDSTSLGELMACPQRYKYSIVEGWTTSSDRLAMDFGSLFHLGLELYERLLIAGHEPDAALRSVLRAVGAAAHPRMLPEYILGKVLYHDSARTVYTLFRALVWYLEEYPHDPFQTIILSSGKPALELRFQIELPFSIQNHSFVLSGHIDRLVSTPSGTTFMDRKTTKKTLNPDYFLEFDLSLQMDIYMMGVQTIVPSPTDYALIDAVQTAEGFTRFGRKTISRTAAQLSESMKLIEFYTRQAAAFAESDFWPQNRKACYLCQFKSVCSAPPPVRPSILAQSFTKNPPWNPLKPRPTLDTTEPKKVLDFSTPAC